MSLEPLDDEGDTMTLQDQMNAIGQAAKAAASELALATSEQKNDAIRAAAAEIRAAAKSIQAANQQDMAAGQAAGLSSAKLDRLLLTDDRIEAMAQGLEDVANLDEPVGRVLSAWDRPNGLKIQRVSTPLGVIGVIYESRPNVTADAGALCLKAGNATILRGGSDSFHSSTAILAALRKGLVTAGLPEAAVQSVPTTDRAAVGMLLSMTAYVDVVVPRGGKSLVERVQQEARVPVFSHLDGLNHTYVDTAADIDMAVDIVLNAKMRRTGICGAMETLLVHRDIADAFLPKAARALEAKACVLRGDEASRAIVSSMEIATQEDWETEYLDSILAVKVVTDLDEAVRHIATYGSSHTEVIITEDHRAAEEFATRVDAAIVMHNASSQFADGGEFGMGAEIGISTGRMHARGPVGANQLTSYKYVVRGDGQLRP